MDNTSKIRAQVENELGRPIHDPVWDSFASSSVVQEYQAGRVPLADVLDEFSLLAQAWAGVWQELNESPSGAKPGPAKARRRRIGPSPHIEFPEFDPNYARVVGRLLAAEANEDQRIKHFRSTVLGSGLLSDRDVPAWIRQHLDAQGRGDRDRSEVRSFPSSARPSDLDLVNPGSLRRLEYVDPRDRGRRRILEDVPPGVLSDLAELAELLSRATTWPRAFATMFILTGTVPPYRPVEVAYWLTTGTVNPTVASRVSITVDPQVPPSHVERVYRHARRMVFGARNRSLGRRSLLLVEFALLHRPGRTWDALRRRWNRQHPDMEYRAEHVTNFARDAHRARQRILFPSIRPQFRSRTAGRG